jgi:putative FmdB family regulatory protein
MRIGIYNVRQYPEHIMPNYDYYCLDCKKRFDIFLTYKEYETTVVQCKFCGSLHIQRRIGRVRISRSTPDRMQQLADPASLNSIDEDPQALGKMMRQMQSELGEEMPPEFNEVVDRLDHGQSPEQIEKDLPDMSDNISDGADSSSPLGFNPDF